MQNLLSEANEKGVKQEDKDHLQQILEEATKRNDELQQESENTHATLVQLENDLKEEN